MDMTGPRARLDAMARGVEAAWGMTFEEYANLCVDNPAEAQRVADRAVAKLTNKLEADKLATTGEAPPRSEN